MDGEAMRCPKCNWSMHSFNCGTVAFGSMCDNPKCERKIYPQRKFKTYDADTHTIVLPIRSEDELNRVKRIGIEILQQIDMSVDIQTGIYHAKLPDWLKLREDSDYDRDNIVFDRDNIVFDFEDQKGRLRFRLLWSVISRRVIVWSRYSIGDAKAPVKSAFDSTTSLDLEFLVAIFDGENLGMEFEDDDPKPIWVGKSAAFDPCNAEAEAWLNEKYPEWRDPIAYWS